MDFAYFLQDVVVTRTTVNITDGNKIGLTVMTRNI